MKKKGRAVDEMVKIGEGRMKKRGRWKKWQRMAEGRMKMKEGRWKR